MRTLRNALIALSFAAAPALAGAATYELDPAHSSAQFSVRHMMVTNVRGDFGTIAGKVVLDEKDLTKSTVEATIDATSINTRDRKRDDHLKSADFFDVAKFPTITFKSSKVQKVADGKLKVTGMLTMRGVSREVTLDVEGPTAEIKDPWGNIKRGASATTKINRKDFGVNWNAPLETGGLVVGEEVAITLDIQLTKKQAPVAGK